MSANTDSDSDSDTSSIDPRLDKSYGRTFAESALEPGEIGQILAEIHNDDTIKHVMGYYLKNYLRQHYSALDEDTMELVRDIMMKEMQNGVFPYRNALVSAEEVTLQPGDRVFRQASEWVSDFDQDVTKEYEVKHFTKHDTKVVLRTLAIYDPDTGERLDENFDDDSREGAMSHLKHKYMDGHLSTHIAQVVYDDRWYVHHAPRQDDGGGE